MKIVGWLAVVGSLVSSLVFMVLSLNRWEWNRALFFGLIFLIAEVALGIALVLRRLSQIGVRPEPDQDAIVALRNARPAHDRFAWLQSSSRDLHVFITFLVGAGAIVSALAWCIDRIAARTTTPVAEARLARRLVVISYPRGGLLSDADDDAVAALLRTSPHHR